MAMTSRFAWGVAALLASLPLAGTSFAQSSRPLTVTERPHPEVDPLGVRMGSFLMFPTMGVTEKYNDNIYAADTNEVDDYITVFSPGVNMQSQWSRHALNFGASADIGRYANSSSENYEDYSAFANGLVDITRRSNVTGGVSYSKLHEDRGSPDNVNGVNPTEYTLLNGDAAFRQQFNRVNVEVSANAKRYNYDNVATSSGTIINNNDRDRDEFKLGTRVGYEIVPQYEAFVRLTYNKRNYDSAVDDNGFNRDSNGYEAVTGVRLDLSGKTFGDVFLGYRSQNYDDPALATNSGLTYGAALTWNATPLTTAKLDVTRSVEETTQNNASGYFATQGRVSVDHELLRNMLIGGAASYTVNKYKGISREDDLTAFNLYAKYLWNRYLDLSVGYDRTDRNSDVSGSDYNQNILMVKIEAAL